MGRGVQFLVALVVAAAAENCRDHRAREECVWEHGCEWDASRSECYARKAATGIIKTEQKISCTSGGLKGQLHKDDYFGFSVSGLGDLDRDGVQDILVGARGDDDSRGAVYVLFLTTAGTVKAEQKISSTSGGLTGPLHNHDYFGSSVSRLGDLDGDGVQDALVGAMGDGGGAVYVLLLDTDGTVKAEQKISSTSGNLMGPLGKYDQFGRSVSGLGDLDGDGVQDALVGAPRDGDSFRGAVYVLFLKTDGTVKAEQKISSTTGGKGPLSRSDFFGSSVSGLGDLDGDGVQDVLVGAKGDDDGADFDVGAVYVLFLKTDGTVKAEQKISRTSGHLTGLLERSDFFGVSVAGLGDLDGDGALDVLVGAQGYDPIHSTSDYVRNGAVYVLSLNTDGTVKAEQKISSTSGGHTLPWGTFADVAGGLDGESVSGLGDLDGDGVQDTLLVGSPWGADCGSFSGAVHVLFLKADNATADDRGASGVEAKADDAKANVGPVETDTGIVVVLSVLLVGLGLCIVGLIVLAFVCRRRKMQSPVAQVISTQVIGRPLPKENNILAVDGEVLPQEGGAKCTV